MVQISCVYSSDLKFSKHDWEGSAYVIKWLARESRLLFYDLHSRIANHDLFYAVSLVCTVSNYNCAIAKIAIAIYDLVLVLKSLFNIVVEWFKKL